MKIWYAIEIEIARVGESAATSQLWARNTTGIEVSDGDPGDFVTLRAYFDSQPEMETLKREITDGLRRIGLPEVALRGVKSLTVADQDWLAEWKKGYEPVEIGKKIIISPSWKIDQVKQSDRIIVQIDPGMAFGTGTHETTRGCLEMLEKYWPPPTGSGALLDVGTGTGILAIAAIKLSPRSRVVGFDVDPEAIAVAEENAEINGVAGEIVLEVNKITFFHGGSFDVVIANLTADVITKLADDFSPVLKPQGYLIVSGILREQEADVRDALGIHGYKVIETKPDGEWVTIVLRKQALSAEFILSSTQHAALVFSALVLCNVIDFTHNPKASPIAP